MEPLFVAAIVGAALGARHALEPDHLAAVSTLVADEPRPRRAAAVGALWGLGHTVALAGVGLALVAARTAMPPAVERGAELAVAAMLIALGALGIVTAFRDGARGAVHAHHHGRRAHVHAGPAAHVHVRQRAIALRPMLVGVVHGVAGSGALAALAIAEMSSPPAAALYVVAFGLGSIAGMAVVSGLAAASIARLSLGRAGWRRMRIGSGACAIVMGVAWALVAI